MSANNLPSAMCSAALQFARRGWAVFPCRERDFTTEPNSAGIEQVMVARLADYECPKSFRFGPALPRNAMGKLEDWA